MKKMTLVLCVTVVALMLTPKLRAQTDSTGLPGDHFSLEGALEMFRNSGSLEEFEKNLNLENNHVNNLDLNNDGVVDYIKVLEKLEKNAHVFVLQDQVLELESQDIAVLELEKTGDTTAVLQIVGDPDIYGEEIILEATSSLEGDGLELEKGNGGPSYSGDDWVTADMPGIIINVWAWPVVRFVYRPAYSPWVSPWAWKAHPLWWHPWHPLAFRVFHPYGARFRRHCVIAHTHRVMFAHGIYAPHRTSSVFVMNRHGAVIKHFRTTRVVRPGPGRVKVVKVRHH